MTVPVKLPIFLDHHSTTPVDPLVVEAMLPYFTDHFGNPASKTHIYGHNAHTAVEEARATLAASIKADPREIFFTSGATEALNMAIKGVASAYKSKCNHFITVATEHHAVLDCFEYLRAKGAEVTILPVNSLGHVSLESLEEAIRPDTVMVAAMMANNEIGTIHPVSDIGKICRGKGILFLTDATQAFGKLHIDVAEMNIDLLACSSHKIYGPKGVGMLYMRRRPRVRIDPLLHGGGHERGLRSGTLNVPGIVGFGKAIEIAVSSIFEDQVQLGKLRDQLQDSVLRTVRNATVNGDQKNRIAGNLNLTIPGVTSEAVAITLKGEIVFSTGSACTSENIQPSYVLRAIGLDDDAIFSSFRIGLGRQTTSDSITYCAKRFTDAIKYLAGLHPQ